MLVYLQVTLKSEEICNVSFMLYLLVKVQQKQKQKIHVSPNIYS